MPNKPSPSKTVILIRPSSGLFSFNFSEIWQYRDLLILLAWRDISARFRQSVVGYGWAILRPLISALIFTLVFSVFIRIETDVPYPIFTFAGLIPWMYFSGTLGSVTGSLVGSAELLKKVYFPRLILPIATVAVGLIELLLQLIVLVLLMAFYDYSPGWPILYLPIFIFLAMLTALAFGIWLTALNVKYRDVGMIVPFFIQIWMYLSPIVYPVSVVPEEYQWLYSLNPMVGVIEGFRWSMLGNDAPHWGAIGISAGVMLVILFYSLVYFRKVENTFADIV